jgi:hypothetical protein
MQGGGAAKAHGLRVSKTMKRKTKLKAGVAPDPPGVAPGKFACVSGE